VDHLSAHLVDVMFGYLYLLQTRESYKGDEAIYKIGRTEQDALTRFNQYPNGSKLYLHMYCFDSKNSESRLIEIFNTKYTNVHQYGREYFEGDLQDMMNTICQEVNVSCTCPSSIENFHKDFKHMTNHINSLKTQNVELIKQIKTLITSNDELLNEKTVTTSKDALHRIKYVPKTTD
jgi:hypothetical protein